MITSAILAAILKNIAATHIYKCVNLWNQESYSNESSDKV